MERENVYVVRSIASKYKYTLLQNLHVHAYNEINTNFKLAISFTYIIVCTHIRDIGHGGRDCNEPQFAL